MNSLKPLYNRIFAGSASDAHAAIMKWLTTRSCVTIQFAYFAALKMNGWYEGHQTEKYEYALLNSDFLLPDGIALRLLHCRSRHPEIHSILLLLRYRFYAQKSVKNLNGTDFLPSFLSGIKDPENYRIVLYGTYPDIVAQAAKHAEKTFGIEVVYQDGYSAFNFDLLSKDRTNIFLAGLWVPKQEIWIEEHKAKLADTWKVIAFGVGGLIDFWWWREKRAPEIVRSFSLEWLWRLITNPRKNAKKVATSLLFFVELFK